MFERISGFFKKFSRRRKRQSGETTILDGKEPGMDDFGLDDDFGGMDSLEETADTDGLEMSAAGSEPEGGGFSDFDLGSEGDDIGISTGGSDFDEKTISDEISGVETGVADTEAGLDDMFPDGVGEEPDFGGDIEEPEPTSLVKRIATLVIALIIATGVGVAFQIFLWPNVSKMVGMPGADEPKLDVQTEVNAEQRKKVKLQKELRDFRQIGGPEEVKGLQEELAQVRDAQGALEVFDQAYSKVKQKEASYDALLAKIKGVEGEISKTRSEIVNIKSEIEKSRDRVIKLAKQSEEEYERFRLELVRAELSQRLVYELKMEDIESFRAQVAELSEALSRLTLPDSTAISTEAASEMDSFGD
jgi:flagellin-like hook-associated protein FlgL